MEKLYQNEKALEAYIGTPEKYYWYKVAFSKYDLNGIEKFSWVWSWYSFFFGPLYLLYRKCYVEALVVWIGMAIISSINGFLGFLVSIALGGTLPYLIFKRYKKTIEKVESVEDDFDKQLGLLSSLGGTNKTARNIGIIIYILTMILGMTFTMFFYSMYQ